MKIHKLVFLPIFVAWTLASGPGCGTLPTDLPLTCTGAQGYYFLGSIMRGTRILAQWYGPCVEINPSVTHEIDAHSIYASLGTDSTTVTADATAQWQSEAGATYTVDLVQHSTEGLAYEHEQGTMFVLHCLESGSEKASWYSATRIPHWTGERTLTAQVGETCTFRMREVCFSSGLGRCTVRAGVTLGDGDAS